MGDVCFLTASQDTDQLNHMVDTHTHTHTTPKRPMCIEVFLPAAAEDI